VSVLCVAYLFFLIVTPLTFFLSLPSIFSLFSFQPSYHFRISFLFRIGACIDWNSFGVIRSQILAKGVGPGGNLMIASFVFLLISCVCYSVTGCCSLGPLPGVGAAATNCCCTESNPSMQPFGVTRVMSSSPQVTVIQQGGGQPGYEYPPVQAYPPQGYPMPPQGYPAQPQEYLPQAYPVQAGPTPTYAAKDAPSL